MEKNEIMEIPLRSEEVQEILDKKPDFAEKWTLLIFFCLLMLLIGSTWFIKYPDTIEANAKLIARNAPKEIISLQEGRLVRLFVQNDEHVSPGKMIAWIESVADHNMVISLSQKLDSSFLLLNTGQLDKVSKLFEPHYGKLGELQANYQQFIISLEQFNDYLVNGFFSHKELLLKNDITTLLKMNESIKYQKYLTEEDMKLAEESFKMNNILSDEQILSPEEFRMQKSKFVNKQMMVPQLNTSLLSNENLIREKQKEIYQMKHDIEQQKVIFEQALETFKSAVDE